MFRWLITFYGEDVSEDEIFTTVRCVDVWMSPLLALERMKQYERPLNCRFLMIKTRAHDSLLMCFVPLYTLRIIIKHKDAK